MFISLYGNIRQSSAFQGKHSIFYVDKTLTHTVKIRALGKFDKHCLTGHQN